MFKYFFLLVFLTIFSSGFGQDSKSDSTLTVTPTFTEDATIDTNSVVIKKKSPKVAGLLSAVVPGAGQIYNGSYWKAPVVYAGAGALYYFINDFSRRKTFYHEILKLLDVDSSAAYIKDYVDAYPSVGKILESNVNGTVVAAQTENEIKELYNSNSSRLQNTYLISVLWYGLNILDAVVDAHLKNFDVSDDLSLKITPNIWRTTDHYSGVGAGINLTFSLK